MSLYLFGETIEITAEMVERSANGYGPQMWINNTIRKLMAAGF